MVEEVFHQVTGLGIELDSLRKKLEVGKLMVVDLAFDILAYQGLV
jgi:hypothetical protein